MASAVASGWVVWLHLVSTLFMVGVIWYVQVVHYPLMACVGGDRFEEYHAQHTRRTGWVVVPAMLLEMLTAVALALPTLSPLPAALGRAGLLLLAAVWLSIFGVQVPLHRRLAHGFDARLHRRLVRTNWLRTTAWSLRGALAVTLAVG
jgi:hypothetical protein